MSVPAGSAVYRVRRLLCLFLEPFEHFGQQPEPGVAVNEAGCEDLGALARQALFDEASHHCFPELAVRLGRHAPHISFVIADFASRGALELGRRAVV
jgi:hypothetical protein